MRFQAEEALQIYIEESRDHLTDVEKDLLQIEKQGSNVDEELINKVFRSAHSIKGGAALLGFNNIKELAHKMENLLGKIRDHSVTPDTSVINILLKASDTLRSLVDDTETSDRLDISEHIEALIASCDTTLTENQKTTPETSVTEVHTTPIEPTVSKNATDIPKAPVSHVP